MRLGKLMLLLALIAALSFQVVAAPICEVDLTISNKDKVNFLKGIAYEGIAPVDNYKFSKYQVQVTMEGKRNKFGVPVVFHVPHVGDVDEVMVTVPFLCDNWEELSTLKNGVEIFQKDISAYFCDENDVCGLNENELSCPSDCPKSGKDNWCNREADGTCDPDCLFGDVDCIQTPSLIQSLATVPETCNRNGVCELYENGINCPSDCKKEVIVQPKKIVTEIEKGTVTDSYVAERIFIGIILVLIFVAALFLYRKKKSSSKIQPPRYTS